MTETSNLRKINYNVMYDALNSLISIDDEFQSHLTVDIFTAVQGLGAITKYRLESDNLKEMEELDDIEENLTSVVVSHCIKNYYIQANINFIVDEETQLSLLHFIINNKQFKLLKQLMDSAIVSRANSIISLDFFVINPSTNLTVIEAIKEYTVVLNLKKKNFFSFATEKNNIDEEIALCSNLLKRIDRYVKMCYMSRETGMMSAINKEIETGDIKLLHNNEKSTPDDHHFCYLRKKYKVFFQKNELCDKSLNEIFKQIELINSQKMSEEDNAKSKVMVKSLEEMLKRKKLYEDMIKTTKDQMRNTTYYIENIKGKKKKASLDQKKQEKRDESISLSQMNEDSLDGFPKTVLSDMQTNHDFTEKNSISNKIA